MDDVLSQLESTNITPKNDDDNKTNFDGLYKNWGRLGNQEERRKEILEVQKYNRNSKIDKYRGILELVEAVEEQYIFGNHNRAFYRPSIYVAGFNKAPSYSEVLMMSEWMVEKPEDFETNWVVVPCPKGTRVLVVASNGITRLYSKFGHQLFECRTGLPGGNPADPKMKTHCCVMDGFYQKNNNTLYILDILAWNSQPMTDGELEFRDYWMRSHLPECRDIRSINKRNELNFNLLPKVSCAAASFQKFMMKIHFPELTAMDGLLFFHKRARYTSGVTPLVGWLFPYMVPEIIGSHITVNKAYMLMKPVTYKTQADFIADFNARLEKKQRTKAGGRRRNSARDSKMDTAEATTEVEPESVTTREEIPTSEGDKSMETTPIGKEETAMNSTAKEQTDMDAETIDTIKKDKTEK